MPAGKLDKRLSKSPGSVYMNTVSSSLKKRDSHPKFQPSDISTSITRPHQIQGIGAKRNSVENLRQQKKADKTEDSETDDMTNVKTAVLDEELQDLKTSKKAVEKSLQLAHEQNEFLKNKAEELEKQLDEFKLENEHLKYSTTRDEHDLEESTSRLERLEAENNQLKGKVKRREEHIKKMKSDKAGRPGQDKPSQSSQQKPDLPVLRRKPDRGNGKGYKSKACVIS